MIERKNFIYVGENYLTMLWNIVDKKKWIIFYGEGSYGFSFMSYLETIDSCS